MNTPTPRTDAAWAKTFLDDDDQCRAGNAASDMRDCSRELEREIVTFTGAYACTHHNDQQRAACPVCLVATPTAESDRLRAQLHALTLICGTNDANKFETWVDRANARAERAEAELAKERARLDWLGDNVEEIYRERDQRGSCVYLSGENIRDAIDAAMKGDAK